MTVRLLHSADLHLDAPLRATAMADPELFEVVETASRRALDCLVEHCRNEEIAALLLAGDVFDGAVRSIRSAAVFMTRMQALNEAGVQVYMIRGNHDAENDAPWKLDLPPNVHEFGVKGGVHPVPNLDEGVRIRVHGVSFGERSAPDSLLPLFARPEDDGVDIGLLHTSLSGASGHDPYAPCSVGDLVGHGYDYWALGHVHSRTVHAEGPNWIVMPGAPQCRHINETGKNSATEITLRNCGVSGIREVPTAAVLFEHVEIPCEGVAPSDIPVLCRTAAERCAASTLSSGQQLVIRFHLVGAPETLRPLRFNADLRRELVREELRALETCWLEDLKFAPVLAGPATSPPETGVIAELAALMRDLAGRPGMRRELEEILASHLDPLPGHLRERLCRDEEAQARLSDDVLAEAIEDTVAALDGEVDE